MQDILIVTHSLGYMPNSIKEALEAADYNVVVEKASVDGLNEQRHKSSLIVLYVDEKILLDRHALIYLKDMAIEEDLPIYIVGDSEEIDKISDIIPKHLVKIYPRPFNVKQLVDDVGEYLRTYSGGYKRKILIVDDSGTMLRCIKSWLSAKYQVILANSGTMAIKYLVQNDPDLILLDYEMPVCDGKQVLEMIRSEPEFDNIPVMFLTSKGDRESVMNVMALKPDGYLLKTMSPKQIIEAIDDFFEKRKAR